jgi:hypothetical protein
MCDSDIIRDDAAQWRQCCQAAFFELDPIKLLVRIPAARSAALDRIEDRFSRPSHVNAMEATWNLQSP